LHLPLTSFRSAATPRILALSLHDALPILAAAAAAAMLAATDTPSLPRACCTAAPSGLEVRVSRNTPRRFSRATSMAPVREPAPRYGDRVTASPASGEPSVRYAAA